MKKSTAKTPEQAALDRMEARRKNALVALPARLDRVQKLIAALGGAVSVTSDAEGRRIIRSRERRLTVGPDVATLRQGTIFQRPAQAGLSVALRYDTAEARVLAELTAAVPAAQRDHVVLRAATREVVADLFLCGDDEAVHLGAAGRRVPLQLRPTVAKIVAEAHAIDAEAVKRTRQAIVAMPALVRFVPAAALIAMAAAGKSVTEIAEAYGGRRILGTLDPHALLLVTPDNVRMVCEILDLVRDIPPPRPRRKKYSEWLDIMLHWWAFGEAVPGLNAWLTKGSFADAHQRGLPTPTTLLEMTLWAEASWGKRGGWTAQRAYSRAQLEAATWADGLVAQSKSDKALKTRRDFYDTRAAIFSARRYVRPLRNAQELYAAGITLSNCMRTHAAAFAEEAAAGRAVYLGVFTVRTKTDPQTAASMMVADKLQSAAEVRLGLDGKPLGIRQHTAWANSRPTKADAAALQAWIEERL